MPAVKRRLQIFLALFLIVTAIGTIGFMVLENLSLIDAFYYNIVTMSTVGYGDIHPTTPTSRLFAILLIIMGGATFIGVIANATEMILLRREAESRMHKINMVLGVFFSELGYTLLSFFSDDNPFIEDISKKLLVQSAWKEAEFSLAEQAIQKHGVQVEIERIDLEAVLDFLHSKRNFQVNLLENPVLIEQEVFSGALLAIFHLTDELSSRENLKTLPQSDKKHLQGDMNRVYKKLVEQWIFYLRHLKAHYPYLFSLAVRKNPFDPKADPIVK